VLTFILAPVITPLVPLLQSQAHKSQRRQPQWLGSHAPWHQPDPPLELQRPWYLARAYPKHQTVSTQERTLGYDCRRSVRGSMQALERDMHSTMWVQIPVGRVVLVAGC
jgi:hypothetical protein